MCVCGLLPRTRGFFLNTGDAEAPAKFSEHRRMIEPAGRQRNAACNNPPWRLRPE
jgi:hypothetical protein